MSTTADGEQGQPDQPYVGPRPFQRKDASRFFGREREVEQTLSLTIASRTFLIYSESGIGKSSLINARLIPRLEREEFEVFYLPRSFHSLSNLAEAYQESNIFALATLMGLAKADSAGLAQLAKLTLVEYLTERKPRTDRYQVPIPRVIIFDQFEEFFTLHPDHWAERAPFFEQIRDAMTPRDDNTATLHVVFVLREEYIAQIDRYAPLLPEKLRARVRLERMGKADAIRAIEGPLEGTERSFAEGVAEALFERLSKERVLSESGEYREVVSPYVEPVLLQVVCQQLWNSLTSDTKVITRENFKGLGDTDKALRDYYERCIEETKGVGGVTEGQLRVWFEHELINSPEGTRGAVRRGTTTAGSIPNEAAARLNDLYIVKADSRPSGDLWYELAHDRLIAPIQNSNADWGGVNAILIQRHLDEAVREWTGHNRDNDFLYRGERLDEAQKWAKDRQAALTPDEAEFLRRSIRRRNLIRGLRWIAIAALVIISLTSMIYVANQLFLRRDASGVNFDFAASDARLGAQDQLVSVAAFSMDKYEITYRQYRLCVQAGGCIRTLEPSVFTDYENAPDDKPVTWVTGYQAYQFCQWIGRRLPTSAEWERAERGTDGTRKWPWGDQDPDSNRVNLQIGDYQPLDSVPVDQGFDKGATLEGQIKHMLGNVREWTETPSDSGGVTSQKRWNGHDNIALVIRDFGWATGDIRGMDAHDVVTTETPTEPNYADRDLGFRCATG